MSNLGPGDESAASRKMSIGDAGEPAQKLVEVAVNTIHVRGGMGKMLQEHGGRARLKVSHQLTAVGGDGASITHNLEKLAEGLARADAEGRAPLPGEVFPPEQLLIPAERVTATAGSAKSTATERPPFLDIFEALGLFGEDGIFGDIKYESTAS